MRRHDCPLPPLQVDTDEADDWCCSGCGQWWRLDRDYCHECGRSAGPVWLRTVAPRQGPDLADGEHWRNPPPAVAFPMVVARRGGIRYGAEPYEPPPYSWVERDADIKRGYAASMPTERFDASLLTPQYEVITAAGWCAPSETIYDLGDGQ